MIFITPDLQQKPKLKYVENNTKIDAIDPFRENKPNIIFLQINFL